MLAVVKTPRINFRIEGNIPQWIIKQIKKVYGNKVNIKADKDEESVNVFETNWYKKISKKITPGFSLKTYKNGLSFRSTYSARYSCLKDSSSSWFLAASISLVSKNGLS